MVPCEGICSEFQEHLVVLIERGSVSWRLATSDSPPRDVDAFPPGRLAGFIDAVEESQGYENEKGGWNWPPYYDQKHDDEDRKEESQQRPTKPEIPQKEILFSVLCPAILVESLSCDSETALLNMFVLDSISTKI